jgi:CubicO group peptidase (beta-lactamase class C family)
MSPSLRLVFSAALLAACIASRAQAGAAASPADPRIATFAADVEALRERLAIAGVSVAVVEDGKLLWADGFGYADVEHRVPATADTLYHIASVTKTFTAVRVHRLVEQGRLHLDDPVAKYTDEVKDPRILVRHLLSHTADGTPGDAYAYNPEQFEHLKALLEKVDGRPLRQQVVEEILDPLHMDDTVPGADVVDDAAKWAVLGVNHLARYRRALAREAKGYSVWGEGEIVYSGSPPREFWASAGLVSTVRDLAKFELALERHDLLHKDTLEDVWKPVRSNAGQPLPFGLGWYVTDYRGERLVFHYGHWGTSFSALHLMVPARRVGVVLLANSEALADHNYRVGEDVTNNAFACRFLNLFVPSLADTDPRNARLAGRSNVAVKDNGLVGPAEDCAVNSAVAVDRFRARRRADARTPVPLDPALAAQYAGRYRLPHRDLTVTDEGGHLFIDIPKDGGHAELFAASPADFFIKFRPWKIRFVKEGGKVVRMEFADTGYVEPAPRIEQ